MLEPIANSNTLEVDVELVSSPDAPDLIGEVNSLRESNARWKRRCIAGCLALIILLGVSFVQYMGTFVTCRMMDETREEVARCSELMAKLEEKEAASNERMSNVLRLIDNEDGRQIEAMKMLNALENERKLVEAEVDQLRFLADNLREDLLNLLDETESLKWPTFDHLPNCAFSGPLSTHVPVGSQKKK